MVGTGRVTVGAEHLATVTDDRALAGLERVERPGVQAADPVTDEVAADLEVVAWPVGRRPATADAAGSNSACQGCASPPIDAVNTIAAAVALLSPHLRQPVAIHVRRRSGERPT